THNIRANCLCPGSVNTEFARHAIGTPPQQGSSGQRVVAPMGRQAAPSELASVLSFLLSKDASYVTGTTMMVDGGYTAI
ncbi:MAG: SDR family oxidoreductase, partial [Microbacteriaceae bacterium]|nr:SDR family oxidoreductase [Microbacteriaceae bacterium]